MAIRYAVANGVWSNTATWDGGTLPTSADDVFANNRTVTIDQDVTASSLRNTSNVSPAITQGGSFVVTGTTGTRNITLSGVSSILVVGTLTGFVAAVSPLLNITSTSAAITNINSNLIGGGGGNVNNAVSVVVNGNSTVNIAGRVGQSAQFTNALTSQSSGAIINVIGDVYGCPSGNGIGITQPATVTVTGTITGSATSSGPGITVGGVSTVNVTGSVFGGNSVGAQGILASVAGSTINVTGNLTAGTGEALGDNNVVSAFNITGNVTASSTRPGIVCANITLVTLNGNMINSANVIAVYTPRIRISPTTQQSWTYQTAGADRLMYTANAFSGGTVPAASDVRLGVSYAGGALTGTCAVPSANSVAFGVPVDATTGTTIITRAQLLSDMGALVAAYPQI